MVYGPYSIQPMVGALLETILKRYPLPPVTTYGMVALMVPEVAIPPKEPSTVGVAKLPEASLISTEVMFPGFNASLLAKVYPKDMTSPGQNVEPTLFKLLNLALPILKAVVLAVQVMLVLGLLETTRTL